MIAAYFIPIRSILIERLSVETRIQRRQKSKKIQKDNEKDMHPFFAWISSLIGTSDHQKQFYSFILKILSPSIVAWITTLLGSEVTAQI